VSLPLVMVVVTASPAYGQARAVQDKQDLINWYYAATFGTGVYTSGDRTVAVVQLPISYVLQPASEGTYGLTLKIPITLGVYDYDFNSVLGGNLPDRLSTLSVMPGLEWEIPLRRRWTVKPYFSGGMGHELSGKESALIYDFGVRSRFVIGEDKGVEFAMVNLLTAAGYRPRGGPTHPFGVAGAGLDIVIPTNKMLFGRDALIGFTPIYYYYFNSLSFAKFDNAENRLREEFELAVSILSRRPWSLKFFDVDRVGLAIRTSGDITGVTLFTSLPF
jgi:hypothetical protein